MSEPSMPDPMTDPKLRAFLDLVAWSEGTSTSPITRNFGYDVIVSGVDGPEVLDSYADHPFAFGRPAKVIRRVPLLTSTAAGRYQILLRWWEAYKTMLHLPDFTPQSQDAVAVRQIQERGAIPLIETGDVQGAIRECSNIWASLPGNDYDQAGGKTVEALVDKYQDLTQEQA